MRSLPTTWDTVLTQTSLGSIRSVHSSFIPGLKLWPVFSLWLNRTIGAASLLVLFR